MSRTDIRTDNIVRQRPPVTAPALSPMMQRVARQAAQSRLDMPQMQLPPVTGQTPPQQPQEADTGLMGALRAPLMSPRGQAISQAALAGLEAGGYTTMPTTLGQAIGKMGQAAMTGYAAGEDRALKEAQRKAAAEKADFDRRMAIAEYRQKEREIGGKVSKEERAQQVAEVRLRRDLRKDFESDSKYFGEAQQFWRDVVTYSKPEQSSAADLALVFSYMKMLDPDSVVREGEQMQVQGLGGIGSQARSFLSRIGVDTEGAYDGGMLIIDAPIRAAIREAAALRFGDLAKTQYGLEKYTADEGSRAGLSLDFFKSKLKGDGDMKRPYVVNSLDDLPDEAKSGDYVVLNGVFTQIREQS